MKRFFTILLALAYVAISQVATAQFVAVESLLEVTGVSNQGLVVGYESFNGPYMIWDAEAGVFTDIGGIAPGNGVGGQATFSDAGDYLSGTCVGSVSAEMSRYNVQSQQWVPLGNLGFIIENASSGGYAISGDGNTVVGNSWADTNVSGGVSYTHAVAWSEAEGLMDLGSLFAPQGRSSRANAANYDGSVVVGWQDYNGPWKSAVWRKNPSGGYYPNEYLLIDPNGNPNDEYNQLGECSCVSSNGEWIGGYGDYANNYEPWIWSEATGVVNLGTLAEGAMGYVSGMNADATVVVGWFTQGMMDPYLPFIWTPAGGLQNLNDYLTELGINIGANSIYAPSRISSSGQYIAGWGVDMSSYMYITFWVNLFTVGVDDRPDVFGYMTVQPNPANGKVMLKNNESALIQLSSLNGQVLYSKHVTGDCSLDVSGFHPGVYLVTKQTVTQQTSVKLVVY